MLRSRRFVPLALVALALGIGANTAVFTVVNAVLLSPLPYEDADRMVALFRERPTGVSRGVSVPKYFAWRETASDVLADLSVYDGVSTALTLTVGGDPEQVNALHVSGDFFRLFRAQPMYGRFFTAEEDAPGGPRVVVLGHGLWTRRFGANPQVLGSTLVLGGEPHTVIGIMAPEFEANPATDMWLSLQLEPASRSRAHVLLGAARLKPGITLEAANARMKVVAEELRHRVPEAMASGESAGVIPLREAVAGQTRPMLLAVMGAVILVQLLACANIANLLLVRAIGRGHEMMVRSCFGATRRQLMGQLVVESLLLALAGGTAGLLLGHWSLQALVTFIPPTLPRFSELSQSGLDVRVVLFALASSVVSGLIFGIAPVAHACRTDLAAGLREQDTRGGVSRRRVRAQGAMTVAELALALVLLVAAGLLIRSALLLNRVDPGFNTQNVLAFKTQLGGAQYTTTAAVTRYGTTLIERLERLPGVRAAAYVTFLPTEGGPELAFDVLGRTVSEGDGAGSAMWRYVSPRAFDVLGIPMLRGRLFSDTDTATSPAVAIVNAAMARRFWPNEDPIGQQIVIGRRMGQGFEDRPREIVAIVADAREGGLEKEPPPVMYLPQPQMTDAFNALTNRVVPASWIVKAEHSLTLLEPAIRRTVHSLDPHQASSDYHSLERLIEASLASRRAILVLLSIFAAIALSLAAIGVYGVFSYALQQRSQEMAIRFALGAQSWQVLGLAVRQNLVLTAGGIGIGLLAAFGLSRLLKSLVFGVQVTDATTFVAAAVVLAVVAFLTTFGPLRRLAALDPVTRLRHQ